MFPLDTEVEDTNQIRTFVCRVCAGAGLLLNNTCPLCDGTVNSSETLHDSFIEKQCFFPGEREEGSVLVAPNPILNKTWGACVDILTSYSLSDCHPEQPKRFTVAMEEGILPNAILPGSNILFPGDPADFFCVGSVLNHKLAGDGETPQEDFNSLATSDEGAHVPCKQSGTSPIQIALALAHEALFHELTCPDMRREEVKMVEHFHSTTVAERHLEEFAKSTATWDNFLKITTQRQGRDIVPDATEGFAKASWLASEIVLSMAIRLTKCTPVAQASAMNTKFDMQLKGGTNENVPMCMSKAKYGVAVVRPAGHHSGATLDEFSLSAFCGLNHVLTAASYLAYEGKRVLVIDLDAHFAKGSQQIALAVNKKLQRLGKPRILVSDISAALYQGEVAKEAAKEGHLVFSTNPRGSTEMEAIAHANWFPPAHLKNGELNDSWLCYALLRTLAYCTDSTFFADVAGSTSFRDDVIHRTKSEGPDVILVSFGLDAAKGEPDPEADCTCLGYAMMAEILKKQGVPVVFALEGGGYRYARDLGTMGLKVFPGLLENNEDQLANSSNKATGAVSSKPSLEDASSTPLFEEAVEMGSLQMTLNDPVTQVSDTESKAKTSVERRQSHQISIFGGNFQTFVRALGGHFDWSVYDPAHELRNHVVQLKKDTSSLTSEEMKLTPEEYMAVREEASSPIKEARCNIEARGKQIQDVIDTIYKANHLYVDIKAKKLQAEKSTTKNKRKAKA